MTRLPEKREYCTMIIIHLRTHPHTHTHTHLRNSTHKRKERKYSNTRRRRIVSSITASFILRHLSITHPFFFFFVVIYLAADDPGLDMFLEEEPWWWWGVWPSREEGMAQWESSVTRWVMGASRRPSSSWWESSIERSSGPLSRSSPSLDSCVKLSKIMRKINNVTIFLNKCV